MLSNLLPSRSTSPLKFTAVVATITWFYTTLVNALLARLIPTLEEGIHDPVVARFGRFDSNAILGLAVLLLKPLLAALCIAGVIEALRRVQPLYARPRLLCWVATLVFWLYLSFLSLPMALCLLPVLWVYANSYLRWRDEAKPSAWRTAFAVTLGIQFIHNVLPAARYLLNA